MKKTKVERLRRAARDAQGRVGRLGKELRVAEAEERGLSPCPFCGSLDLREKKAPGLRPPDIRYRRGCIVCNDCGGRGPGGSRGRQIEKWNARI